MKEAAKGRARLGEGLNERRPSIIDAAYKNSIPMAQEAMRDDPGSINSIERGQTALHLSVSFGNVSMVTFLLQQEGIDVSIKDHHGRDALDLALVVGHEEIERALFQFKNDELNRVQPAQVLPFKLPPAEPG